MPREARKPHDVLTTQDRGVLRHINEIDIELCDGGTMIYVETDQHPDITITTIIPGHPIGEDEFHGGAITGLPDVCHPMINHMSRWLRVGGEFKVKTPGAGYLSSRGIIVSLRVWSSQDYQPGT